MRPFYISFRFCFVLLLGLATLGPLVHASLAAENPAAAQPDRGPVLARVNEVPIYEADVQHKLLLIPETYKPYFEGPDGRKKIVEQLINDRLIFQAATRENFQEHSDVREELDFAYRQLINMRYIQWQLLQSGLVSSEDIKRYYDEQLANQAPVFAYKLKRKSYASQTEAKKNLGRIPTESMTDLGYLSLSELSSNVAPHIEKVALGAFTKPLLSNSRWEVYWLEDKLKTYPPDFNEETQEQVKGYLLQQKQQDFFIKFVAELRKNSQIEIVAN